jgi:hypothetical protein
MTSLWTKFHQRQALAISLCYSAAILIGLEALHGNYGEWLGMNPQQTFTLSAIFVTVMIFIATYLLCQRIANSDKP